MYGTPNNSIHEFGITKNVILARLHGGKRHLYFKKASCFRHFLTKSMLANYTISRKSQHNAALYLFIFWACRLHFASLRVSRCLSARLFMFLVKPSSYPNACQRLSSGRGASTQIVSLDTGWTNEIFRESSEMLPSGLLRLAPYFKSPLMGQPIAANWQRIWWCRPVISCTSKSV